MDTLNSYNGKSPLILPKYDIYNADIADTYPIIMLNSSRYNKEIKQALLEITKDRTVYIIDLSFIPSRYEQDNLRIEDAPDLLNNFFKVNKIEKSILLTNMETFKYGVEIAVSSPRLVEKLVCINPPISPESFSKSFKTDLKRELRACTIRANHSMGAGFINQQIISVGRVLDTDSIDNSSLTRIKCPVSIAYDESMITNDSIESIVHNLKNADYDKLDLKDVNKLKQFLSNAI